MPRHPGSGRPHAHRSAPRIAGDGAGRRAEAGREAYGRVERVTDEVAATAYAHLGDAELDALAAALTPVTLAVLRSGVIPDANPIGLDTTPPSPTV